MKDSRDSDSIQVLSGQVHLKVNILELVNFELPVYHF